MKIGNIQIIENLGAVTCAGTNVVIQGTGEGRYMEFNFGNSRFKMSLSTNKSVTGNKYISRLGLIKSIGVQSVLEAMQHQSELPDNIKTAVRQQLTQVQTCHNQQQGQTSRFPALNALEGIKVGNVNRQQPTQPSHLPPLNQSQIRRMQQGGRGRSFLCS